jgi:hypothetical protein
LANPRLPLRLLATLLAAASLAVPARADRPSLVDTAALARADGVVRLPGLVIHGGTNQFIEAEGTLCLTNGILEFIAVEPKGREYESLLALRGQPSGLQFALLLIGCTAGPLPPPGQPGEPKGDRLQIDVAWQEGGQARQVPVRQWILDRRTGQPPTDLQWVFTGSTFIKGIDDKEVFLADAEQAFISLWQNRALVINPARDYGNPYQGNDQGFAINREALPPLGTAVRLIIRKQAR